MLPFTIVHFQIVVILQGKHLNSPQVFECSALNVSWIFFIFIYNINFYHLGLIFWQSFSVNLFLSSNSYAEMSYIYRFPANAGKMSWIKSSVFCKLCVTLTIYLLLRPGLSPHSVVMFLMKK